MLSDYSLLHPLDEDRDGGINHEFGRLHHLGQEVTAPGGLRDVVIADYRLSVRNAHQELVSRNVDNCEYQVAHGRQQRVRPFRACT